MSTTLVQPDVVKRWDEIFAKGVGDKFPNLDLVRLEKWFFEGKPGKILEYGFGAGINLIHMLECGYEVEAVDSSIEAIKALEKKVADRRCALPKLNIQKIDVSTQRLPFADESFDYVLCMSVLSLLGSRERVLSLLKEFARVLKKGGKTILDVNGPQSDFARLGEPMGNGVYIFSGFSKKETPFKAYCPETAQDFAALVKEHFSVDDVGFHAHKYLHSEIQEFIVCGHKN